MLAKYTICTNKELLASLGTNTANGDERCLDLADDFDAFRVAAIDERAHQEATMDMIYGAMYLIHREYVRTWLTSRVVIPDAKHVCTGRCETEEVSASTYAVPGYRERLHVCVDGTRCAAPACLHLQKTGRIEHQLFVCVSTSTVHICTPDRCTAVSIDCGSSRTCPISNIVLGEGTKLFSAGWVEDEWRTSLSAPKYVDRVPDAPSDPATLSKRLAKHGARATGTSLRGNQRRRGGGNAPSGLTATQTAKDARAAKPVHSSKNPPLQELFEILRTTDPLKVAQTRLSELVDALEQVATDSITRLLPGSVVQTQVEARRAHACVATMLSAVEKYTRKCTNDECAVSTSMLNSIYANSVEWASNARAAMSLRIDRNKAATIARGYAIDVVKFLVTLYTLTDFHSRDIAYMDYVCAVMYMQKRQFRVSDVVIFQENELMVLLPQASQLTAYGYRKSSFTHAKTAVQFAVDIAITNGIDPSRLVYPVSPFDKIYI
jgi:hypothetical protein